MPMARKHSHDEHANHEAWAIPYADLMTLLLAFFVVMYALSTINEAKYRVMADAMSAAFGGTPTTLRPVQVGDHALRVARGQAVGIGQGQRRAGLDRGRPLAALALQRVVADL
ncbi:flagellar motor protein MotB, partial [Xanthomonas sp. LMG 12459]|uniref:flagellar motor protein MotB n=1 Tax=Xanthomonas sp. LMG 12459 TaxID=1591131 RepID=UPI00272AF80E